MYICPDKYNYYYYISINEFKMDYSIIADTQLAINLEEYFYNPKKLFNDKDKDRKYMATKDYLIETLNKDTIYGVALQEACWDYEKMNINQGQYEKMETALKKQYKWNIDKIESNTIDIQREFLGYCERKELKEFDSILKQKESNPTMLISYACIMKLYILFKTVKNKITAYESFINFLDKELLYSLSIESCLAVALFCGKNTSLEFAQKILKFGGKTSLKQMWNSCWDIFFIRLLIMEGGINNKEIVLVSADKGIVSLAKLLNLSSILETDEGISTINTFEMDNIILGFEKKVEFVNKNIVYNFEQRMEKRKGIQTHNEYIFSLIEELEEKVKEINK